MSTSEASTTPTQEGPSLWQRSVWPLVLFVSLPLFVLSLTVWEWLSLEGRWADLGGSLTGALAVGLSLIKADAVRDLRRQRREAEAAAGGSGS